MTWTMKLPARAAARNRDDHGGDQRDDREVANVRVELHRGSLGWATGAVVSARRRAKAYLRPVGPSLAFDARAAASALAASPSARRPQRQPRRSARRRTVADPEVGVDVAPARRDSLELGPQLAHEHVDRTVAAHHRVPPHALVDLLAFEHPSVRPGELPQELVFLARESRRAPRRRRRRTCPAGSSAHRRPRPRRRSRARRRGVA